MEFTSIYGIFTADGVCTYATIASVAVLCALGYMGAPLWLWTAAIAAVLVGFQAPVALLIAFAVLAVLSNIKPLRQMIISSPLMKIFRALELIPRISPTERTALEAGVVWMEAELFSGKPDFKKMMSQPVAELTAEEQKFLDNETEQLCKLIDDWQIWRTRELPTEVWDFIKKSGFLGLIIPKEYGGLGFSPAANSAIVQKVSSRSIAIAIYVMVPNSLGPAELLNYYGTPEQKKKYLPRLAKGDEIPCFGLTEPTAGSDAASIQSEGVLFKGDDGQIYIRLNWRKRWITLASISTLIGLAFRLRDPENLLGKGEDVGITTGLIPSHLQGVVIGKRHDPLGIPFHNCPTEGHNVVMKAEDAIIGGLARAGHGWQMLMECLGAGRGISLPAQAAGGTKLCSRVTSNHASVRKQFGVSIGKFEGVEEPLARIAGSTYLIEALRRYVLSALNQHIAPPVVTAIAKFNATELSRKVINDTMDVMGGAGISMGRRNTFATQYIGTPIGITVEGANILTRTLMIFGQGALRAHPYAFKEVDAIEKGDVKGFDRAFWGHIGHIVRNLFRSVILSVTRGRLVSSPMGGKAKRYFQKIAWASASFAIMADLAMGLLGGSLKVKEKLTGRFADILSWMFIGTAVLKRWQDEGCLEEDLPFVRYSMATAFYNMQEAFDGIFANLDVRGLGWFFGGPIRWWSRVNFFSALPSDRTTNAVAKALLTNEQLRDRLTKGIFIPTDPQEGLGRLERAYSMARKAEAVERKIRQAVKAKTLKKRKGPGQVEDALKAGVITREEFDLVSEADRLRLDAIQVEEFTEEEYLAGYHPVKQSTVKPNVTAAPKGPPSVNN